MSRKVTILHNRIDQNANIDESDVLIQIQLVKRGLLRLGYKVEVVDIGYNIYEDISRLEQTKPLIVFNLVEAVFEKGELLYMIPALLNMMNIPYSGVPHDALFITTSKVLSKKIMRRNNIPTPDWFTLEETHRLIEGVQYIYKPIWEDGSVGLEENAVFDNSDQEKIKLIRQKKSSHYFIEEYIHGREFSIGLIAGDNGPDALPAGEMVFVDYPENKPRILGYKEKWHEDSEEYNKTIRKFGTLKDLPNLEKEMKSISLHCWEVFGLRGYARVDFRVDQKNHPYVIEINGNPCISPNAGFIGAAKRIGLSQTELIRRIMNDIND